MDHVWHFSRGEFGLGGDNEWMKQQKTNICSYEKGLVKAEYYQKGQQCVSVSSSILEVDMSIETG